MKSCLGLLIALVILAAVLVTGAGIWYLSSSTEFSRKDQGSPQSPAAGQPAPAPAPAPAGR